MPRPAVYSLPRCGGPPPGHLAIARLFNDLFAGYRVTMSGGHDEPLYLPPDAGDRGEVRYVGDHAASALHEAAHWCVAGDGRRRLVDYGYDYAAPPRDAPAQERFFRVELTPQALEYVFAGACGVRFTPSVDDPGVPVRKIDAFGLRIRARAQELRAAGLAPRAARFERALASLRGVHAAHG